ncbi:MAG: hypothetical protein NPIRA01_39160 [Nitrospirales bacterium]|nr:MAG: hypothetical protein NPIRA01_39160 [Nitrospirales bacterium]
MKTKFRKLIFSHLFAMVLLLPNLVQGQVADFSATRTNGATTDVFAFTDISTGGPTNWAWEFGDGSTANISAPAGHTVSHTYSSPGTYSVKLTITAPGGSNDKTIPVAVTSPPSGPTAAVLSASFIAVQNTTLLEVTFANTSSGPVTSWTWDFGDGVTNLTDRNPNHTYATAGTYTVRLIVRDPTGRTSFKTMPIMVPVQSAAGPANARKPIKTAADCWDNTVEYSGDLPGWRSSTFEGEWTVGLAAQAQALKYDFASKKAGFNSGLGAGVSFRFYQDVKVPTHGRKPISQIRTECRMSTWKTKEETWLPKATPLFSISPIVYATQLTSEDDLAVEPAIMLGFFDDIVNFGTGFNLTGKDGEVGNVFLLLSIGAGFNW